MFYEIKGIKKVRFVFSSGLPLWDSDIVIHLKDGDITTKNLGQALLLILQKISLRQNNPYGFQILEIEAGKLYKFDYKVLDKICGKKLEYESSYNIKIEPLLIKDFLSANELKITYTSSLTSEIPGIRAFAKKLNNND